MVFLRFLFPMSFQKPIQKLGMDVCEVWQLKFWRKIQKWKICSKMTFCMNVSRFMNLAAIFSLDLESQYKDFEALYSVWQGVQKYRFAKSQEKPHKTVNFQVQCGTWWTCHSNPPFHIQPPYGLKYHTSQSVKLISDLGVFVKHLNVHRKQWRKQLLEKLRSLATRKSEELNESMNWNWKSAIYFAWNLSPIKNRAFIYHTVYHPGSLAAKSNIQWG